MSWFSFDFDRPIPAASGIIERDAGDAWRKYADALQAQFKAAQDAIEKLFDAVIALEERVAKLEIPRQAPDKE